MKPSETVVGRHVLVSGRVQGVGFRYFVAREAQRLGLSGWVRNLRDGCVEALLCGPQMEVALLLGLLCKGPPAARVDDVRVEESALRVQGFILCST